MTRISVDPGRAGCSPACRGNMLLLYGAHVVAEGSELGAMAIDLPPEPTKEPASYLAGDSAERKLGYE